MSELFDFGRDVLEKQPFSRHVGVELMKLEQGSAELVLDVHDIHKQQHGFVHGGVISYLADNALTFAGGSILGNSVTVEFKINYVRPATGQKLIARAVVVTAGKRLAVCECKILALKDGNEVVVAVAQGTISKAD